MNEILTYLKEYIDDHAQIYDWSQEAKQLFSLALLDSVIFYKAELLEVEFLLASFKGKDYYSQLQTYLKQIESKCELPIVVVLDEASPYLIKKMLMEKISFLIPGKQMYLPFLAMQIKTEKQKRKVINIQKFSPSTQLIYLYILYMNESTFDSQKLIDNLHLSTMTVSRGLSELSDLSLLTFVKKGKTSRKKIYNSIDKKELYIQGIKYLSNPVYETVYVSQIPNEKEFFKSDLTALSEQTLLSSDKQETYAFYFKNRKKLESYIISSDEGKITNSPRVQLMKYNPELLSNNGYIDPVSMILSLSQSDERIQMSVEELMKKYEWYEDIEW